MVSLQVELTEEEVQRLGRLASMKGRSVTELIRDGVDVLLRQGKAVSREELKRRALELSGRFHSGAGDLSTQHDQYLNSAFRE